jgi:hypothetical protein
MAEPTKKKHIGKKEKNAGFHDDESELVESAMSEMKPQNITGVQGAMLFMFLWFGFVVVRNAA